MKAIIIAAGSGLRLKPLTDVKPKCMLEVNGKTLLQYQIEALKGAGVDRIVVVRGYKKEMINYPEIIYYTNDNYQNNNILHSLFYAEEEMEDEFIAVYSDIFYKIDVVKRLLKSIKDISIVVDIDWQNNYRDRIAHPITEAENVIFDKSNRLIEIGKRIPGIKTVSGEFIGMMKCSKKGAQIFKEHFRYLRKVYNGKPFQKASIFEQAYLTDMLQDIVDSGISVYCVTIRGGWREIDTIQDYHKLNKELTIK